MIAAACPALVRGMGLSASIAGVAAFSALGGAGNGLEGVLFMTASNNAPTTPTKHASQHSWKRS